MTKPIENNTAKGESVYEPFAGSGTTLVACQNLNRKCYAIEISENYCAVILERMQTAFPDIEIKRIEEAQSASMT
jgi:DNA modification methylase